MSLLYNTQKPLKSNNTNFSKSHKNINHHSKQSDGNILHLQQKLGNQEMQRMIKSGLIQAKLKVSQPNDPYEREADRVADQIMRMSVSHDNKTNVQNNSENKIQRKCSNCKMDNEKKEEKELKISRKPQSSHSNLETSDEISNQINNARGGKPLDYSTKDFMESRFGNDFSNVRIHNNSKANELARTVNARAFTVGNNIFFGNNETTTDKKLLAHELTHVVQRKMKNTIQRRDGGKKPSQKDTNKDTMECPPEDELNKIESRFKAIVVSVLNLSSVTPPRIGF